MSRELQYCQAINEALDVCLANDPSVYVMGLGVPDVRGAFGSTLGLQEKYGDRRVHEIPTAENGMTGVAIGSALVGMKPVLVHLRLDFALLTCEQLVNQAAKWFYMFGGKTPVPMVVRMVIGRGWGQGPQHSQSLQSWFAHIPGLKVVMPTTPHDVKGMLIASIEDPNPVLFLEHRWLYSIKGPVPEGHYTVPLGEARVIKEGSDVTIASISHMTLEALRAAQSLENEGVHAEVIDIRSLNPFDEQTVIQSVRKTGRLIIADTGYRSVGFGAEIVTRVVEQAFQSLKCPPCRISLPDYPTPTSPALSAHYYPTAVNIMAATRSMLGLPGPFKGPHEKSRVMHDVPDLSFAGPF